MFLLLFLVSPLLASNFRREHLNSLCTRANRIQLGACNPYFIECYNGQAQLRKCPMRGEIYMHGACRQAGNDCHDLAISFLNEETTRLAYGDQFCGTGMSATIVRSELSCSRQAILCYGQQILPIACPQGKILVPDFSCRVDQQCTGTPTASFRNYFVEKLCRPSAKFLKKVIKRQGQVQKAKACNTWYISCSPQPTIIRCPVGSIFNEPSRSCRPWQQGDRCMMSGVCLGREYQSISLANCHHVYLYCDGPHPKHLFCSPGMVFNGHSCVPPQFANCPICQNGETRPTSSCSEYFQCNNNNWQKLSCDQGTAWRQETKTCEASYTCASPSNCRQGEIVQKSCGLALICNGQGGFDEVKCPPNSKFEISAGKCHYDPNCNPVTCKEGDVIYTPDCRALTLCKDGQYQAYDCINPRKKRHQDLCLNCGNQFAVAEQPSTPAECENGQKFGHQDDCTAFYECLSQKWVLRRCNPGEVWSSQWTTCLLPQFGEGCSIAREKQCQEGERIFNPTHEDCSRLVECQAARWIEKTCPDGYVYDVNSTSCQPGQCTSFNQVITPGFEGAQPPAPPPIDSGFGIFCSEGETAADSYDCSKYLVCSNGQMIPTICPVGSGFNPLSRSCENDYRCGAECQEGQLIPSPLCGHFKVCINGKFWEGRCNKDKKFFNGQCTQEDCRPTYFVPDCVEGSVRPHVTDTSSHFLTCVNGRWEERSCSRGTNFNFETLRCDAEESGPLPPNACYGGETRPLPGSCQDYEECFYGSWRRQRCPHDQYFANGVCVPGKCNEKCIEGPEAYQRDPYDCSQYFQCIHGNWMPRPCAPGTVFNERKLVCDWQRNVPECGGNN